MKPKTKNILLIAALILSLTSSFAIGVVIGAVEVRQLNHRLAVIEEVNDKQTRALFVIAGGLDDLNKQQQLEQRRRELDEKMKELFQNKGPAL